MAVLFFEAVRVESALTFVVCVRDVEGFGRYSGFLGRYCNARCLQLQSLGHQLHEDPEIG